MELSVILTIHNKCWLAAAVIDAAADLVAGRVERSPLDETCERLGIDPARIRARSAKGSGADQ